MLSIKKMIFIFLLIDELINYLDGNCCSMARYKGINIMKKKQFLCSGIIAASLLSPFVSAAGIDVAFKIDESGSMGDDIAAVQANVNTIAAQLPAGSHGAVVGFGDSNVIPHVHCAMTDLDNDLATFQACVNALVASGVFEPGYDAVTQSANGTLQLDFTGAPYCNVLISDEPSNNDTGTQQDAIDAMTAIGGVFFGIAPTGSATTSYQPIADATGGQMFDLTAFKNDPTAVLTAVLQACVAAVDATGRMTGGGRFVDDESGELISHGFELHCNKDNLPNNLEVNWAGNRFHLEGLDQASCSDNPNYDEGQPIAGFDTYVGVGNGRLNGVSGATVEFTFTDQGEPGKADDTVTILIKDDSNQVVLSVTDSIDQGNQQAHP